MADLYAEPFPAARPGKNEAMWLAGSLFILTASYVYGSFSGTVNAIAPPCLFRKLTGIPCLLCGMTRSFAATAHLDIRQAFTYHFLGPVFFAGTCALAVAAAWSLITGRRLRLPGDVRARKMMGWGLLSLLITAWIAKLAILGANV